MARCQNYKALRIIIQPISAYGIQYFYRPYISCCRFKQNINYKLNRSTIGELARKYELHPNQTHLWKKEFLNKASIVFSSGESTSEDKKYQEEVLEKLYAQIGQQKVEIDWLKKKLQ
jgi:transposase